MRIIWIFTFSLLLIYACVNKNDIPASVHEFSFNNWNQNDSVHFRTDIRDDDSNFEIVITVVHNQYYGYPNLIFGLTIISPEGSERNFDFEIFLKDEARQFTGERKGDIYEYEFTAVQKTAFFSEGEYVFVLNHFMPFETLEGIVGLRMKINKLK